ncbi:condensin-2 complex subunit H2-like [Saccostrea cucullata]|uniref:condensin-2 complex subunit H2-like n=1 Tax=Saccostrea cuccullata TaxID=36930 RepID=UPI002ED519C7
MGSSHTQDELESRFANLLQPIRDLTKNWDVDIASSLEDYLEELGNIVITFDGGITTMNFAEAAMLIQGSVCVYSKKVEYLYTLVYQVLDLLASKKKQNKQASAEGNDDEDSGFDKNEDDEFLSLDDIKEHKSIVLKEDEYGNKNVMPIPQMPLSLIPLEEGEKGANPLLSKKGEVLASRNDFKMNTCSVHQSGTLLLDMSHMALLEKTLSDCISLQGGSLNTIQEESTEQCTQGMMGRDNVEEVETNDLPPPDVTMGDNAGDEAEPFEPAPMEDEVDGAVPPNNRESLDAQILRRSERKRVQIVPPKPVIDHWKMIDPHDPGNVTERTTKRGKTFKIPDNVDDSLTNKRKRKKKPEIKKLCPLTQFVCQTFTNVEKYPKNPLKTVSFPELDKPFWEEYKRRQALSRKENKAKFAYVEEENEDEKVEQEDFHEEDDGAADILLPQMNDENLFDAINTVADDMPYSESMKNNDFGATFDDGLIINDYEELVKHHVEQYLISAQEYAQITELSRRVAEWEEKVIPKLEEEDTHDPFDINKYGSLLIGSLSKESNTAFKEVVKAKKTYEVCRIFLASLMLANTGNVEIVRRGELEKGMDKFELHLLSTKRHFEQLEEYQAPSIADKG